MNEETTYIYGLLNPLNNDIKYIGKANDLSKRLNGHINSNRQGTRRYSWIKSLKLNGLLPKMELIDEVPRSEWQFWEMHYISLYRSWGFDLVNGDMGGLGADRITSETRDKLSKTRLGKKTWNKGIKMSREFCEKMSLYRKGIPNWKLKGRTFYKKITKEQELEIINKCLNTNILLLDIAKEYGYKKECSITSILKKNGIKIPKRARQNNNWTAESRKAMSNKKKGTIQSEETIKKRIASIKAMRDNRGYVYFPHLKTRKKISCYDEKKQENIIFVGITEAAKILGVGRTSIDNNLNGRSNIVNKRYRFKYHA